MKGLFPFIVCGAGNTFKNWIQHSTDVPLEKVPIGGNISISQWSLASLYEQYQLHRNKWSRRNDDLDLVRYRKCRLRLWRHPDVSYVVSYSLETPMTVRRGDEW